MTVSPWTRAPDSQAPHAYETVGGEDWRLFKDAADLLARGRAKFHWGPSKAAGPIERFVDLVPDATFGQVVRITQPQDPREGYSPQMEYWLPAPLDKAWLRFRIRFSPGWTTRGAAGLSQGSAYKVAHFYMPGGGAAGRTRVDIENTDLWSLGFGFPGRRYTVLPEPGNNFHGPVGSAWSDGEWYEVIMYHEKTGVTSGQVRHWRRRLTRGGTIVHEPFRSSRLRYVGATAADTFPPVNRVKLGINKNRSNDRTQYLFWGPWEVVDGARYADPFGVGAARP